MRKRVDLGFFFFEQMVLFPNLQRKFKICDLNSREMRPVSCSWGLFTLSLVSS